MSEIQEALDALERYRQNMIKIVGESSELVKAIETCIKLIDEIEDKQQWISVSERLPEVDEDVWVTDDAGGLATVHDDSCGAYEDTGEKFWYSSQNVTAWMPMIIPEPYKGDDAV